MGAAPTDGDAGLRAGAVAGESAEGVAATGEEGLAEGHKAVVEGLGEADADGVGPDDVVEFFAIDGGLSGELGEVDVGAELAGVEVEFERIEDAAMLVERVVAGVARERTGESGETNVEVGKWDKVRD